MKRMLLILCVVTASVCSLAGAAPLDTQLVSADANWLFHFNARGFWDTQLGTLAIDSMDERVHRRLDGMAALLGTDPVSDIFGVTLYGKDADQANAVAVISGRFDREKLLSLLRMKENYQEFEHDDHVIYKWDQHHGVFAAEDTIILSQSRSALETALEVFLRKEPNITDKDKFSIVRQAPDGAVVTAYMQGLSQVARDHGRAAILRNTDSLFMYASEQAGMLNVSAMAQSKDIESAGQMVQVVRGMLALAMLNPDMADLGKMLSHVDIQVDGRMLFLDFSYDSAELFEIFQDTKEQLD